MTDAQSLYGWLLVGITIVFGFFALIWLREFLSMRREK